MLSPELLIFWTDIVSSSRRLLLISPATLASANSHAKPVGVSLLAEEETTTVSSLKVPFLRDDARWDLQFVGSSNGLVSCLQTLQYGERFPVAVVVWNPATDQFDNYHLHSFGRRLHNVTHHQPLIGFDFMHRTNGYKLLIVFFRAKVVNQNTQSVRVVQEEFNLSCKMCYTTHSVTLNGVLYWLAEHTSLGCLVIAFNLHDEAFETKSRRLPRELRYVSESNTPTFVLTAWRNSLAVVSYSKENEGDQLVFWVHDQGSAWNQQTRIRWPSQCGASLSDFVGVWKDQLVLNKKGCREDEAGADNDPGKLLLYDPVTRTMREILKHGEQCPDRVQ